MITDNRKFKPPGSDLNFPYQPTKSYDPTLPLSIELV
jgi:hypothetical protein